jgi:hypothetical protein
VDTGAVDTKCGNRVGCRNHRDHGACTSPAQCIGGHARCNDLAGNYANNVKRQQSLVSSMGTLNRG